MKISQLRFAAVAICVVVSGLSIAGCSADGDDEQERRAARQLVDDHLHQTKIVVTNKQGPQSKEVIEHFSNLDPEFNFLDEQGYITEWDKLTSQQRSQYRYELKGHRFDLGGKDLMSESRRDVLGEVRDASR